MSYAEVGNTITMEKGYLENLLTDLTQLASRTAIEKYEEEQKKRETLSTNQVADELEVNIQIVSRYIRVGKRVAGRYVKLNATKKGLRFRVSRYDLESFRRDIVQ